MGLLELICIVIVTVILPPLGILFVAGCGGDLLVNILFTLLGYFPGHIHAFYVIFVWYSRKQRRLRGERLGPDAFGIFSRKVQDGY